MNILLSRLRGKSWLPLQTRSFRSSGYIRSHSASQLLLSQKTKLARLVRVLLGEISHTARLQILFMENRVGA